MHVPTDRWTAGGWNSKLPQFHRLAEVLGVSTTPVTQDDLQKLFKRVASAKVFADNVQPFIDATTGFKGTAADIIEGIERKLGTTEALPFMSLEGAAVPAEFDGVAIWPTGTANWTKLRLEQIQTAYEAGAGINHVICLNSSRVMSGAADRKHPALARWSKDQEPTEREFQLWLAGRSSLPSSLFHFPALPAQNDDGRPLSLEQQLRHLTTAGPYANFLATTDLYVPSTPNSLYVPLHVRRVLGHDNVWFSQAAARLVRGTPAVWWPSLQDVMTLPNGMLRLWVELLQAGCISE